MADAALSQSHATLQRARELAVQAANGTYNVEDRFKLQQEMYSLFDEIDKTANETSYNSMTVLNGLFLSKTNPMVLQLGANTHQQMAMGIAGKATIVGLGLATEESATTNANNDLLSFRATIRYTEKQPTETVDKPTPPIDNEVEPTIPPEKTPELQPDVEQESTVQPPVDEETPIDPNQNEHAPDEPSPEQETDNDSQEKETQDHPQNNNKGNNGNNGNKDHQDASWHSQQDNSQQNGNGSWHAQQDNSHQDHHDSSWHAQQNNGNNTSSSVDNSETTSHNDNSKNNGSTSNNSNNGNNGNKDHQDASWHSQQDNSQQNGNGSWHAQQDNSHQEHNDSSWHANKNNKPQNQITVMIDDSPLQASQTSQWDDCFEVRGQDLVCKPEFVDRYIPNFSTQSTQTCIIPSGKEKIYEPLQNARTNEEMTETLGVLDTEMQAFAKTYYTDLQMQQYTVTAQSNAVKIPLAFSFVASASLTEPTVVTKQIDIRYDEQRGGYMVGEDFVASQKITVNDQLDDAIQHLATAFKTQYGYEQFQISDPIVEKQQSTSIVTITSAEEASTSIGKIDKAIGVISEMRSQLGSYENHLTHTLNYISDEYENLSMTESRIRDQDIAKGMISFTKKQMMQKVTEAMFAQMNSSAQNVLYLLN